MVDWTPLEKLKVADPDTYVWVKGRAELMAAPYSREALVCLTEEAIWGLSQEPGLGRAMAEGLLRLYADTSPDHVETYLTLVHEAAATGATLGRIMATYLVPVLKSDDRLLDPFLKTLSIMQGKGTYTLNAPLEVLAELLAADDGPSATAFLELLRATFEQPLTYNQSLRLVYLLPKAVRGFAPGRRKDRLEQLRRVIRIDVRLAEPFLEGLERELGLLTGPALERFVSLALERFRQRPQSGAKFFSLSSKLGQDTCAALQVAASLATVRNSLNRYLRARLGYPVAVMPHSEPIKKISGYNADVCSDGRTIFLPEEMERFDRQALNTALYKTLVRLEAGLFEFGTYTFDLERAMDTCPEIHLRLKAGAALEPYAAACDGQRFIQCFAMPDLAADLFTLYEHARVTLCMRRHYPGLMRQSLPLLQAESRLLEKQAKAGHPLAPVYARLALDLQHQLSPMRQQADVQKYLQNLFAEHMTHLSPVEVSADLVCRAYPRVEAQWFRSGKTYKPLALPYGRQLRWDLMSTAFARQLKLSQQIRQRLASQGIQAYRSDLTRQLTLGQGKLRSEDIQAFSLSRENGKSPSAIRIDPSQLDLQSLLEEEGIDDLNTGRSEWPSYRYAEWDCQLQDYLHDYARVQEVPLPDDQNGDFYARTLARYGGLVTGMRRAFELLKPEGLCMLRPWPEGDDFDYRALLDFAVDRRAGRLPSDRLFIKRLKQARDVAVLLLVDLSRSTSNRVAGGQATVMDVAKEALVLFCEALQVVGDRYALAGFSGTSRHAVEYFRIKDFEEPMWGPVQARISALSPKRSTRMGAAIRHATAQLARIESRVRLMIVVSDGFPNDFGYKAAYAIGDTRQAVQEARARNFHVKAITVNIGSDPRLDELYGRVHHHVIGDVRELPGKLLRLYGRLTKH